MSAVNAATVRRVQAATSLPTLAPAALDGDSREWLRCLRADGATRDDAIARLHSLLLRGAVRGRAAAAGASAPARRRARRHRQPGR
jgi:hypothetical protein